MHQKIYIVDDNYVLNSVKKLITIPGEIGLTIKVDLYTGLRQEEIVHLHKTALCTSLTSAKQKHFLLCKACYWCSSWINNNKPIISKCPSCHGAVESMPLSYNEAYEFDYSRRRGVTLNFLRSRGSKKYEA